MQSIVCILQDHLDIYSLCLVPRPGSIKSTFLLFSKAQPGMLTKPRPGHHTLQSSHSSPEGSKLPFPMVSATFLTVVECLQKQPQSSSLGIFDPSPQERDVEVLPYGGCHCDSCGSGWVCGTGSLRPFAQISSDHDTEKEMSAKAAHLLSLTHSWIPAHRLGWRHLHSS